jgi:threonine/homoserine/homoserine lactone efflux protein
LLPDPSALAVFLAATLLFLIVPGPAVLYVVAQSISYGRKAGLVSVAGIHVGNLVHVAAAAIGLSSLLASSAVAFEAVRYAGAAYLVFLGVRRLLGRDETVTHAESRTLAGWRVFRNGAIVEILNPKTALFFLAFLPQFVDPARGSVALQMTVLGVILIVLGCVTDGLWALAAGTLGGWLKGSRRFLLSERYLSGFALIALGVLAAVTGDRRQASARVSP